MSKRSLGNIMIFFGVVGIAGGLAWGSGDFRRIMELQSKIAELDVRIDTTRASLFAENTRYRGYLASLKSIPDSIKSAQSFILQRRGDDHRKRVLVLERADDEFNRQKRRRTRQKKEAAGHFMTRGLPLAAAGLVLLVVGIIGRRARAA